MTDEERLQELQAFVDLCFACLEDDSLGQVSAKTGLCYATVYRLWNHQFTAAMQVRTLQLLGEAAGLRLEMSDRKTRVRVIRKAA